MERNPLYYYNHPCCEACERQRCPHHVTYTEIPSSGTYTETYYEISGCFGLNRTRETDIHEGAFLAAIRDYNLTAARIINESQKFSLATINRLYPQMYLYYLYDKSSLAVDIIRYLAGQYPEFITNNKNHLLLTAKRAAFPNVCYGHCPPGVVGANDQGKPLYAEGNELLLSYLLDMGVLTEKERKQVEHCREGESTYH